MPLSKNKIYISKRGFCTAWIYFRCSNVCDDAWDCVFPYPRDHYGDVIMGAIVSQITSLTIVYSTVYSDADQRKYQSSASVAFVRGIHRGPAQMASNAENVSIWWRHHDCVQRSIDIISWFCCALFCCGYIINYYRHLVIRVIHFPLLRGCLTGCLIAPVPVLLPHMDQIDQGPISLTRIFSTTGSM